MDNKNNIETMEYHIPIKMITLSKALLTFLESVYIILAIIFGVVTFESRGLVTLCAIFVLIISVTGLITAKLADFGLFVKNHFLIMPWLVMNLIHMFLLFVLIIIISVEAGPVALTSLLLYVFAAGVNTAFWTIIYKTYQSIKITRQERLGKVSPSAPML